MHYSSRKHVFSSKFISASRRKLFTRFCLGIGASLLILTGLLLSYFFKGPYGSNLSLSPRSCCFSFPASTVSKQMRRIEGKNVSLNAQIEEGIILESTHLMNLSTEGNVSSFDVEKGEIDKNALEANGSFVARNASSWRSDIGFAAVEKTQFGNFSASIAAVTMVNTSLGNYSINNSEKSKSSSSSDDSNENSRGKSHNGSYDNCDIYDGRWKRVDDDTMPYYPPSSCPYVEGEFDCHGNGRPDDAFVKWRWQPNGCDIPRLNATDFLERLRGKKLVFVGDSVNRNMWESLVCVLRHSVKDKKRVYETAGRTNFKKKAYYSFRFKDYNCSVDFVVSRFLVRESSFKSKNGSFETLRLDLMDKTTSMYRDVDILIFNTGHWWTHEKTRIGKGYYQEGNYVHPRLNVLEAYTKALTNWAKWVDKNINSSQTRVIFKGFSITHFGGGRWNSGGQCHSETEPIHDPKYLGRHPSKMRALERVLRKMKTPVIYMNISRLTDFRKDGHPSIYRKTYKTEEERIESVKHQDCSHWCLPGVPDTWNQLLYVSLLMAKFGSLEN